MIFPTQILRLGAAPGGTGRWSATDLATLAGTGALQCRNSIDTGLALGTQCRCDVRHWPLKCRLNSDTPSPPRSHDGLRACDRLSERRSQREGLTTTRNERASE